MSFGIPNKSFGASDPFTKFSKGGTSFVNPISSFDPISAGLNLAGGLLGGQAAPALSSSTANTPVQVGGLNTPAFPFPFGVGSPASVNNNSFTEKVIVGVAVALAVSGLVLVVKAVK